MKETILKVLAAFMNSDVQSFADDTKIKDIPGFESLQFVMLLSELQEVHGINIPLEKAIAVETVGELVECAERM